MGGLALLQNWTFANCDVSIGVGVSTPPAKQSTYIHNTVT